MRVLILSCNTGEGHNAAGLAIKEQLELQGHEAVMLDMMSFGGKHTSALVGGGYVENGYPDAVGLRDDLPRRRTGPENQIQVSGFTMPTRVWQNPLKRYLEKEHFVMCW